MRPSALDLLADLTAAYMFVVANFTARHATNSHPDNPIPNLDDILLALQDASALQPQMRDAEEQWRGEEDLRGLETVINWITGPVNREIRRIAGFVPSEGDVIDAEFLEQEDYLTTLKKKHSKTGEESRYAGTVLGKSGEEHLVTIEGGDAMSIQDWATQIKARITPAESISSAMSSVPSSLSDAEELDI
jgi:transcription initiation factor TFIID subunit 3